MTATTPITSRHHPSVAALRQLNRRRERDRSGRFTAEGEDLLAAADAAGWTPVERFCAAGSGLPGRSVAPEVLDWASALGSGTRTAAIYEQRWGAPLPPLCVYLHEVADPGNVGAVLRSALAFGASSVALGPRCADPFGPKAVRASMGAIFALAVARVDTIDALPGRKLALVPGAGSPLEGPAGEPVTILVGAERAGLPDSVVRACDEVVHIPLAGATQSLNAAMAATVAFYELTRAGTRAGTRGGADDRSGLPASTAPDLRMAQR